MKTLALILCLLPTISYSQDNKNDLQIAGNLMLTGSVLTIGGGALMIAGSQDKKTEIITVIGGMVSGIGIIVYVMGINHIRIAGKKMNDKLQVTFDKGIGLRYRI